MLLQRPGLPGSPDTLRSFEYRIGLAFICKGTKHTSTGTSHPGISVSSQPFYRLCYRLI